MNITLGLDGSDTPKTIGIWIGMGVNEFFVGFVPPSWSEHFGWELTSTAAASARNGNSGVQPISTP